ncbi:Nucleoporin [Apiospora saccharicola]|uniref:Nucleoporin n=1 Tax=Apiospora saccharicola TaxID=335842 RepID=A0ABR1WIP0_9PEZI
MSFSLDYTPRKAQPVSGQRGASFPAGSTPAASRFRSSLVPMAKTSPARSKPTLGKSAARPTRNLFDTATPKPARTTQFAPALPATAFKASAGARKFAPPPKTTNAGMAGTTSAELFKMRIPEPDAGLTGEALAGSIPEPLTKRGTVYADQYLADKCPPDFDDLQRRQFFCILDLRRLKHAANEIFVKKDWKVNILNFAKEYEKSRGLIMLHYGLYEFKNVKPSEDVMRRWRAAHGLPEPEVEKPAAKPAAKVGTSAFVSSVPASSTKRKADVQLQPSDNTLKASTANHNKRRNLDQDNEPMTDAPKFAPSPLKSKRRVEEADDEDEEADENQRNKLQKTPSTARSRLEGIINNVQSNTTTPVGSPLKRSTMDKPATSLFSVTKQPDDSHSPFASKSNPFGAPTNGASSSASALKSSLFQPAPANGASSSAPALKSSLFQPGSTLSASKDSVLTGHKFGSTTAAPTAKSNIFGYLSESSANNSGNEKDEADAEADSDTSSENETEQEPDSQDVAPSYEPSAAASTGTATPPAQGGPALFSFGKPSGTTTPLDAASKPAGDAKAGGLFARVSFGADGEPLRATSTEAPAKEPTPEKEAPSVPAATIAPAATATPAAAKTPGDFTFNASTTPISFGSKNGLGSSIFASKAAVPSSAGDQAKAPTTSASSIFAAKPSASQAPPATSSSSSVFGNLNKGPEATKSTPNGGLSSSIFGAPKPAASAAPSFGGSSTPFGAAPKPAEVNTASTTEKPTSMFGVSSAPVKVEPTPAASSPFAGFNKPSEADKPAPFAGFNKPSEADKPVANGGLGQSIFSNSAKPAPSNMFGQSTSQNSIADSSTPRRSFDEPGPNGRPIKRPTSRFGRAGTPDRAKTPEVSFGASQPGPSQGTTSNMGSSATLFGSPAPNPNAPAPANMFASNNSVPTPSFSFGAPTPAEKKPEETQPAQSNIFSFGSQTNPSPVKETTAAPMFSFGSQNNASQSQAKESVAAPSMFSFGAGQATTPTPSFGGPASQPTNGTPASKFDFNFSGAGTPGGNASSFTFGGNDQGAASNPGSFTFGAAPNASAAPAFGVGSATPTPAGSFNFQFGGNAAPKAPEPSSSGIFASQPNGSSQAPAFSFGSGAPPSQYPIANKAPQGSGIFGSLQPPGAGGTSTGANSPFPAPSSMNSTPMGGTPEPQTQDGEEAPQEQISLTTGGPGEENEEILLEVRAKATKFVPVVKGGDADEDGNKSPWRTQGLGPLRVLKNKNTGCVRLLLRAEPRGHVAMNKALLAQFEYKPDTVKKTSIKIMTAKDDGAGLETWLLQVKKPEMAAELATVLEANKNSK